MCWWIPQSSRPPPAKARPPSSRPTISAPPPISLRVASYTTKPTSRPSQYDRPLFITHYPAQAKAFYMQPDPKRPEVVLCADLIAPEGYGEICGGSQRIHDLELLRKRIEEHALPMEAFEWYLDLRKYGSVPHSGFGMGIERLVCWICGVPHLRETIPFPRMLDKIYP